MSFRNLPVYFFLAAGLYLPASAGESEAKSAAGIKKMQLVTDVRAIAPNASITVALVILPEPDYHIYWRGPGIVGVAPVIKWSLPDGFTAGPIEWPAPEKVDMAGIGANGYKTETWLLSRIQCPPEIKVSEVTLKADIAWMACSKSCHPGLNDLSLTLPVKEENKAENPDRKISERFAAIRKALPPAAPLPWKQEVALVNKNRIDLTLTIPDFPAEHDASFEFYCDDMQVDSDTPTKTEWVDRSGGVLRLSFVRPDYAPKSPKTFSGLIEASIPFPVLNSPWAEISVPWPENTFPDE